MRSPNLAFRSTLALHRGLAWAALLALATLTAGCATPVSLALTAAGVATDTSITWAIAKHVHEKLTDGDPVPCYRLDTVQRALSERCGAFVPGSVDAKDVITSRMQVCPLIQATQQPLHWAVLPELLNKGAQPEHCLQSPLVRLAQHDACPAFALASPEELKSLAWLAEADARAVRHDVVRMLSCPSARAAGLHRVLDRWLATGLLHPDRAGFGVLGALHPDYLNSPFARALEASGHTAQASLGGYDGRLPGGFETALRGSNWAALDWWLTRVPGLANSVPPTQGNQLPWVPLARVLVPSFIGQPEQQAATLRYLLAHGANPGQRLPHDDRQTVTSQARKLKSPWVALLESPPVPARPARQFASAGDASSFAGTGADSAVPLATQRVLSVRWDP